MLAEVIRFADKERISVEVSTPNDTALIWLDTGCEGFIVPAGASSTERMLALYVKLQLFIRRQRFDRKLFGGSGR